MALTKATNRMTTGASANVLDFGAVGDGVADDGTAVQNAINAANANGGGTVFFPEGTYELSDINLTMYSNITIQGEGHSSIIQGWSGITATGLSSVTWRNIRIKGYKYIWNTCTDVLLENIYFENENYTVPANASSRFCQFTNSSRLRIVNCYIENCQYGIWIGGPTGSDLSQNTNVTVEGCHIKNTHAPGYSYPAGINIADGKNVTLTNNIIEDIYASGGTQAYGIYQGDNTTFKAENIVISNNTILECSSGIMFHSAAKVVISDNIVTMPAVGNANLRGIASFGDLDPVDGSIPTAFTISGNVVTGADISMGAWHNNTTITGNTVTGGLRGISTYLSSGTEQSYYLTIDGNTIVESELTGILLQNTHYCTVSNNTIVDCNTSNDTGIFQSNGITAYTGTDDIYIHDNFIINETANGKMLRGVYFHSTSDQELARKLAFNNIAFNVNTPMSGVYSSTPTHGTWELGEKIYYRSPAAAGKIGTICTTRGTNGTLAAVTGSGTTGTPTLTVNSAVDLRIGQHITVAGAGSHRIINIVGVVVTLATNLSATVSGVAVSYSAAVFKDFGAIDA
jgi:parallel beta-helix repeat protein